jgi:uncharacterized protein YjbI with pentapeptide repeats
MAKQEHVSILEKGVAAWNKWRNSNPKIYPDLARAHFGGANLAGAELHGVDLHEATLDFVKADGADFHEANLKGATFRGGVVLTRANFNLADLTGAYLRDADLRKANLSLANLRQSNLRGCELSGANLKSADLTFANLIGAALFEVDLRTANISAADLTGADLRGALLSETMLDGTDLTAAVIGYTKFVDVDLSTAKGIGTITHNGPSSIGIDSIYRSRGKIPIKFLRHVGIPENFIEFMSSLAGSALEFHSCFISYSNRDHEFVERLHADLQSNGVRCWFAPENLKIGDLFRKRIDEAIHLHDKLLIVLSDNSVRSPWVEKEVETAFEKECQQNRTVLFPIRLDDAVMETEQAWAADIRRMRHIGDFHNWKIHDSYKKAFDRLLRDLKSEDKIKSPV